MTKQRKAFIKSYDKTFTAIRGAIAELCKLNSLADDPKDKETLQEVYMALSKANRAMYDIPDIPF